MTYEEGIKTIVDQLLYKPEIVNGDKIKIFKNYIVAGMGGSGLAADIIKSADPSLRLTIHKDYGLPFIDDLERSETLVIASSYSGNTEETIDALRAAEKIGLARTILSMGGKLTELAQNNNLPYLQIPDLGIPPRLAVGFSLVGLLKLMKRETDLEELRHIAPGVNPGGLESEGKSLAQKLIGKVPLIYSSYKFSALAYNWKIKFNETAKIPAFCNYFPELNHNEMTSFDTHFKTQRVREDFCFIFLEDRENSKKIKNRMEILKKYFLEQGFVAETIELKGDDYYHKIFHSLILADWTAYYLAREYNVDPSVTPLNDWFKREIAS